MSVHGSAVSGAQEASSRTERPTGTFYGGDTLDCQKLLTEVGRKSNKTAAAMAEMKSSLGHPSCSTHSCGRSRALNSHTLISAELDCCLFNVYIAQHP